MRKLIAALAAAAMLLATLPAYAGGGAWRYGHGYSGHHGGYTVFRYSGHRHYGYRPYRGHGHYRYRYYGRHHDGDVVVALLGGLLGGVVIGSVLSQPRYAPPPAAYLPPRFTHCVPTTGVRILNGREALYGGTMCYDRNGTGFIQNDSVHFLYYLD